MSLSDKPVPSEIRLSQKDHELKMTAYTLESLSTLPPSTKIFKSFGKAFIQSDLNQVKGKLATAVERINAEMEELKLNIK